jgi:hypothetical protein
MILGNKNVVIALILAAAALAMYVSVFVKLS